MQIPNVAANPNTRRQDMDPEGLTRPESLLAFAWPLFFTLRWVLLPLLVIGGSLSQRNLALLDAGPLLGAYRFLLAVSALVIAVRAFTTGRKAQSANTVSRETRFQ